ncbi:MAG: hypothetical protein PSX81_05630 [bacterium]|nr:hypothetical protein [bacterium]
MEIITDKNFEYLSWHDNFVYSILFPDINNNFNLIVDYIIEWINVDNEGYKFKVAPAIITFENVDDLIIQISFGKNGDLFIEEITRDDKHLSPNGEVFMWRYTILLNVGKIEFLSTGFHQVFTDFPKIGVDQKYDGT